MASFCNGSMTRTTCTQVSFVSGGGYSSLIWVGLSVQCLKVRPISMPILEEKGTRSYNLLEPQILRKGDNLLEISHFF